MTIKPGSLARVVLAVMLLGCSSAGDDDGTGSGEAATSPTVVVSTSAPVAWIVDRLAGSSVQHLPLVPDGEDARHWRPRGEELSTVLEADLVITNGAGLEPYLEAISLPLSRVVETTAGVELVEVAGLTHSHGDEGEHSHREPASLTALDPSTFAHQLGVVAEALCARDSAGCERYRQETAAARNELDSLAAELSELGRAHSGVSIGGRLADTAYLVRGLGIELEDFELVAGSTPEADTVEALMRWAQSQPSAVVMWLSTPPSAVLDALPETVRHVVLDPLSRSRDDYDYLRQARSNISALRSAFEGRAQISRATAMAAPGPETP